jgi:serine protease AprX
MRYSISGATAEQVKSAGGTDIRQTRHGGVIFATLNEAPAERLKSLGCRVKAISRVGAAVIGGIAPPEPIAAAPTYSPYELVWAAGFEDVRNLTVPPLYGEGMNVAVIDTGIRASHQALGNRVVYQRNYTADPPGDPFNHGTGVASIVLAVAPRCHILDLKALDSRGMGTAEEVILAIDDCIGLVEEKSELAPHVINLSLGMEDNGDPDDPLRVICREATGAGIWVSAAAGNYGPDPQTIMSPACEKYVFATGSIGYEPMLVSGFSSRGPTREGLIKPDAVFYGENIRMASSLSDTAEIAKSGTSFAAPFCSGIAVLYQEGVIRYGGVAYVTPIEGLDPELRHLISIQELLDNYLVRITVKPKEDALPGKDYSYGCGMPFGALVRGQFTASPASELAGLMQPISVMMALGLTGMILKGALNGGNNSRQPQA